MIINRMQLIKALSKAKDIAKDNKIRQILEGVLLKKEGDYIKVIATDLSNSIITLIKTESKENLEVVFNPALVLEYINQLDYENIDIEINEENNLLRIDGAEFLILDKSEYPKININVKDEIKVNSAELKNNIIKAESATCKADNLALQCIRFDFDNKKLCLVASDTYRMIKTEQDIESDIIKQVSVPNECLKAVLNILNECEEINISFDSNNIIFSNETTSLKSRLIELEFPAWKSIIKGFNSEIEVEVNTNTINKALKRINIFNRDNINVKFGATFDFKKNKIEIKGMSERGKNNEKIDSIKDGNDIKINLNSNFFITYTSKVETSSIKIRMSKENSPVMLQTNKDDNFICLMMPLAMQEE